MDNATRALIEANAKLHKQLTIAKTQLYRVRSQLEYLSIDDNELCWEKGDPDETCRLALEEIIKLDRS